VHGHADGSTDYRYEIKINCFLALVSIFFVLMLHDGSMVADLIAQFFTAYRFGRPSLPRRTRFHHYHLHHYHLHHDPLHHYHWMIRDTGA
jgi:hypothetical protein